MSCSPAKTTSIGVSQFVAAPCIMISYPCTRSYEANGHQTTTKHYVPIIYRTYQMKIASNTDALWGTSSPHPPPSGSVRLYNPVRALQWLKLPISQSYLARHIDAPQMQHIQSGRISAVSLCHRSRNGPITSLSLAHFAVHLPDAPRCGPLVALQLRPLGNCVL